MAKAEDYRGLTVEIGRLRVAVPVNLPANDEEIIEHEKTIAAIKSEIRPHKLIVTTGKDIVSILGDDITAAIDERKREKDEPSLPFTKPEKDRSAMSGSQLATAGAARRKNKGLAGS